MPRSRSLLKRLHFFLASDFADGPLEMLLGIRELQPVLQCSDRVIIAARRCSFSRTRARCR